MADYSTDYSIQPFTQVSYDLHNRTEALDRLNDPPELLNPFTGKYDANWTGHKMPTANIYTVTFADGTTKSCSIAQLVMMICLNRAADQEQKIINQMEAIAETTVKLEVLTRIQETIVGSGENPTLDGKTYDVSDWPGATLSELASAAQLRTFLKQSVGITSLSDSSSATEVISAISSQMDSMNSVSQTQMIELQAMTNKRDQSYDLISNCLKSLNTVLMGNANNL